MAVRETQDCHHPRIKIGAFLRRSEEQSQSSTDDVKQIWLLSSSIKISCVPPPVCVCVCVCKRKRYRSDVEMSICTFVRCREAPTYFIIIPYSSCTSRFLRVSVAGIPTLHGDPRVHCQNSRLTSVTKDDDDEDRIRGFLKYLSAVHNDSNAVREIRCNCLSGGEGQHVNSRRARKRTAGAVSRLLSARSTKRTAD